MLFFLRWEASPSHFQRRGEPRQGLSWRRRGLSQWCTSKIEPTIYVEGWIKHLPGRGSEKSKFSAKKRDDFARYDRALTQLVKRLSLSKKNFFQNIFFLIFFSIQSRMVNMPAACSPCLQLGIQTYGMVPKPKLWSPMHATGILCLRHGLPCMQHGLHACGIVSMPVEYSAYLLHGIHASGMVINPNPCCLSHQP